jgi:hypothetical protein
VDAVLFDKITQRASHPVWNSSSIKVVIWLASTKDHGLPDGWTVEHCVIDHAVLGGVSNGQFHVTGARRSEDPPFSKLEMFGVPTNLSHATDVMISKSRKATIPSLEEPTLGTARGLVDWKKRFMPVLVPSAYSETE